MQETNELRQNMLHRLSLALIQVVLFAKSMHFLPSIWAVDGSVRNEDCMLVPPEIKDCQSAIQLDSNNQKAYNRLAAAYIMVGNLK